MSNIELGIKHNICTIVDYLPVSQSDPAYPWLQIQI